MSVLRERITWVWLGLMMLTVFTTWGLSKELLTPAAAVTGTFLIVAIKGRYVVLDFMELRRAALPARAFLQGWIVVVIAIILSLWIMTPTAG